MLERKFYYLITILLSALSLNAIAANLVGATEKTSLSSNAPAISLQTPLNDSPGGLLADTHPIDHPQIQKIGFREDLSDTIPHQHVAIKQASTPSGKPDLGLGVTARIGTTGIGLDVNKSIIPQLNARLGVNFGSISFNRTDSGIQYDSKLELSNVHLLGDYYPIGGSNFRVTGGFFSQNNRFSVTGLPQTNGSYNINGTDYNAAQVGNLTGEFKYGNSIAPYLGVGFGQPTNDGLAFNVDLGVMFTGSPKVSLTASNPIFNTDPIAQQNLNAQAARTQNDLQGFNVYPVLSFGVSYGF